MRRDFIYSFFLLFVLSTTSIFFLLSQSQFNAFAIFTVDRNNGNEDSSDSIAKIILTKIKYRSDRFSDDITGQVMNVGNGTAESIRVIFTYYDKRGNVIGSDYTHTNQDLLKPGQKSPFSQMVDEETGDDMEAYEVSLSWENPNGSEEYVENVQVEDENNFIINLKENLPILTEEEIEKLGLFER
ncbi:MAG TPA: FxLYD domain-containing protein [Nitrososphaeraceae archaeon]|nr:FxLYD domain-containing protein [Nitrososphaeraceae archaeon]